MTMLVEQDGNLPGIDVAGLAGYREGLDDGGFGIPKGSGDPERGSCDGEDTELPLKEAGEVDGTPLKVEYDTKEKLREITGKPREDHAMDDSAKVRSRALQQAVSQGVRQAQRYHQQQQAQSQQPTIIRWERFLPQHQLRVLLVEEDDATRHVVSALLRNCSYEVTSAANGLLAWELLMDQSNKVDIVLTEVVMRCLSGIGLLMRIMSHEPLKHIPVIMMSSHDSMGVVFKCLSKGAVDFLVKPVRKNELKNLWQHIWRRCHSSSGSGSGSGSGSRSGSQTLEVAQPDAAGDANNSGSNDESDGTSSELNIGGGSDNGSGTQSSWTKKAVEVESSHQGIPDGLSLQLKNGCASGAIHQEAKDDDACMDTKGDGSPVVAPELAFFHKERGHLDPHQEVLGQVAVVSRDSRQFEGCTEGTPLTENRQRINLVSEIPMKEEESKEEQQAETEDADELMEKHASNSPSSKDKTVSDSSSPSMLKISLKRPCQTDNDREHEIRGGLKHSCSSAFSRYQNTGHITPLPGGTAKITPAFGDQFAQGSSVGSSHPQCNPFSSQADRVPYSKTGNEEVVALPYFRGVLHVNGNQESSGPLTFLTGKHGASASFSKEEALHLATGAGIQMHFPPPPAMLNVFSSHSNSEPVSDLNPSPHWGPSSDKVEVEEVHVSYRHSQGHHNAHTNQDPQIHHHHSHHHHHHHHHIQHHYHHHQEQLQQRPQTPQQEDSTLINGGAPAPKCGSTNMGKGPEGNNNVQCGSSNGYGSNGNGAVSLNGSASGSNNGSNGGQSSVAAVAEPAGVGNVDSGTQLGGGSGVTAAHHTLGADESRHARREAALTKFRQKRKERCFEKKVRYQSRKRLAEQRPRVRGQFVRQSVK